MSPPFPLRNWQIAAAVVGGIAVLAFGPRMDGPRIMWGMRFTTKMGQPGLTDLGWLLLVTVPPAAFLVVGLVGRWVARLRSGEG